MAEYFYDDGGSNTAPYDTWAKASTTLAAIIAGGLAAGETTWIGNDTAGEALAADTTYIFPGTPQSPNKLISVQKDTPPSVLLAGAIMSVANTKTIYIRGSVYVLGVYFNIGTNGASYFVAGHALTGHRQVYDSCKFTFGLNGYIYVGNSGSSYNFIQFKNCTIKAGHVGFRIQIHCFCEFNNITVDATGSAITGFVGTLTAGFSVIQNSDLSAGAQGLVLLPATSTYGAKIIIRNCKLPANWNGTLVAGDAVTSIHYRAEMYNCDSGDTNYRIWINDYFGKLVQETTLVANGGATDGTTRLSWKIVTTANANQVNPFETPEIMAWNDTEGTQRTCTVEVIHNAGALLKDNEIWLDADYSVNTTDPLYAKASDRVADLIFTAAANQTASTKDWDDLVTARANNTAYNLGDLIKVASNAGRVFICTTAGNSDASEPAGYAGAVDGDIISEGAGLAAFTAMYRQKLSVTLPAGKPANKGFIIGTVKCGKASVTVYIDPYMDVA